MHTFDSFYIGFFYLSLKEGLFVYGLLDGFSGVPAVDYFEQRLLLKLFMDHLSEDFESI